MTTELATHFSLAHGSCQVKLNLRVGKELKPPFCFDWPYRLANQSVTTATAADAASDASGICDRHGFHLWAHIRVNKSSYWLSFIISS